MCYNNTFKSDYDTVKGVFLKELDYVNIISLCNNSSLDSIVLHFKYFEEKHLMLRFCDFFTSFSCNL